MPRASVSGPIRSIVTRTAEKVRKTVRFWWGGIGCRIAFIMSLSIFLASTLLGMFLLWEGNRSREAEVRGRAMFIGNYFSALAADDLIAGNRSELYRKLAPAFLSPGYVSRDLLYLRVYDRRGDLLTGSAPRGHEGGALQPRERIETRGLEDGDSRFRIVEDAIYELDLPVLVRSAPVGFVQVGISRKGIQQQFSDVTRKAVLASTVLLLFGLVFSQIIAAGIIKPIATLSAAVDELGKQNWQTPIPVRGRDELSRLATAFNQMASTLKERETSLSRGNRDLFILHAAGLDLMESLDMEALLGKIAARAADLVKADTTAVAAVNHATGSLEYLGVTGGKARQLKGMAMPLEAGGIYNWMASYGTPLLIADAQADIRLDAVQMQALGVASLLSVPLWSSNTMLAIITVVNKKGGGVFDRQDLRLFTVFAGLAGAALQNAFLYADLKYKIGELSNTQQQLVHSTKMAAIGELAANVAHEINNPLTSVLGYTSHLLKTLEVPEESRQKLRMMEQETLRVRKIIRSLLDFSRQRTPSMVPGDLLQPLRETVAFLRGAAERSSVRISEDYPAAPVRVSMDPNEVKQVFINIINNALHAMPEGGELSVRVEGARENETVVEFADTGHGIPPEHLKKIFEPFFSTKGTNDGTGLGLSISYRIMQNHGGRIEVDSTEGRGSRFRVVMPLANGRT